MRGVFGGTGALFPCTLGALDRYYSQNGKNFSDRVGVSGGSIIAACDAYGITTKELIDIVLKTDISSLLDYNYFPDQDFGLIKGEKLYSFLDNLLPVTFKELNTGLNIIACNLGEGDTEYVFNKQNTPDARLADAIRASLSLPYIFEVYEYDKKLFIDGGWVNNYPIDFFGNETKDVIGFKIVHSKTAYKPIKQWYSIMKNLKDYNMALVNSHIRQQEKEHIEDALYASTVKIDSKYSSLDFSIFTKNIISDMIEEGRKSYKGYEDV